MTGNKYNKNRIALEIMKDAILYAEDDTALENNIYGSEYDTETELVDAIVPYIEKEKLSEFIEKSARNIFSPLSALFDDTIAIGLLKSGIIDEAVQTISMTGKAALKTKLHNPVVIVIFELQKTLTILVARSKYKPNDLRGLLSGFTKRYNMALIAVGTPAIGVAPGSELDEFIKNNSSIVTNMHFSDFQKYKGVQIEGFAMQISSKHNGQYTKYFYYSKENPKKIKEKYIKTEDELSLGETFRFEL